ncbi:hypothetical protein O5282_17975 [Escherichia coli]|nr:hypothetical protein [Escherichia coli]
MYEKLLPQSEAGLPPPYGANFICRKAMKLKGSDGLSDNYLIAPGG